MAAPDPPPIVIILERSRKRRNASPGENADNLGEELLIGQSLALTVAEDYSVPHYLALNGIKG